MAKPGGPSHDRRFRCKDCGKRFSDGKPHQRQQSSQENKTVLQMLAPKVCIARIAQVPGLAPKTLEMVEKMLTIFRTYFNFIPKGEDGKTPAMRLGLAKGP